MKILETTKTKYDLLFEAYSDENLNLISAKLIELYKHKNFETIFEISNKVSQFEPIREERAERCFSKLIKLYHPDRGEQYRKEIKLIIEQERYSQLERFKHIETFSAEEIKVKELIDDDIDYHPEYIYDDDSAYSGYAENPGFNQGNYASDFYEEEFEATFYNILKMRMYGHIDIEIPAYYLHDHEDIEMTGCEMEFLDGIEHCIHAKRMDLSRNLLTDISSLRSLKRMEELKLADNEITYLEALAYLTNLRKLDLSFNEIEDISALYELNFLSYLNLEGNDVPEEQINYLKELGVVVIR
jgi:Leucine-rich repeat (LRR) protein